MKKININDFGVFKMGMTEPEIYDYLKARAKNTKYAKYSKKRMLDKFWRVAGRNTCSFYACPFCGKATMLMYYHDVERFANVMFEGKSTYWD